MASARCIPKHPSGTPPIRGAQTAGSARPVSCTGWALCCGLILYLTPGSAQESTRAHLSPHLENRNGTWSLVTPDHRPFFSLGVCVVTPGVSRTSFDPENPSYAAWQQYDSDLDWANATLARLKSWHVTTLGAWSDFNTLRSSRQQDLWVAPVLHLGAAAGAPWWDMWDPAVVARMDAAARQAIAALKDEPHLLGYYSDNEMGWWNATLWKMTLEQAPTSGQRSRLLNLLKESYDHDWTKLTRDFEPEKADSWDSLQAGGMLYVKPGGEGFLVMRRFLGLVAARYYQLAHDLIRRYDRQTLILGDRYQSFYYPEVARAAAPWVDAISSNLNASWDDGGFVRCYLETLHRLTGRPVLVSEFYAAARDNRTGNRNDSAVFPVVATQAERAALARFTLQRLASEPYVIGADWFQFADEPRHGREDGENFNFGLVDIQDRPYTEVTAALSSLDPFASRHRLRHARTDAASAGIPRAPKDPLGDFLPNRALRSWDRERGFVPPASPFPLADLYLCWSPSAVCLGLYALDVTEDAYYRNRAVPKVDRALWEIRVPNHEPLRIRLGAGREPIPSDHEVRLAHLSGVNLTVRNITAVALPASWFNRSSLKAGQALELHSTFWSHGRCYRVDWDGKFTLRR